MSQASIQHENRGEQLKLFINNQMFADVVLLVGPSRRLFYAHRLVLAATSPYFHTMFSSGMKESRAEEIALPDVDETTFELVLEYMYTGKLEVPMEIILPLLVLADQFQCESLCTKLLRNIEGNMKEIMHTPHFLHLPHQLVATLIGSDRLQIDELELFQGLLRWGEKQVQLQSDYEAKGGENSKSHGDRGSERMEEDSEEDEIFFSREERERYKVEMEKRKNQQKAPPESLDGQRTERLREVVKSLMEYVRFPLMDGKDLTSIVERSGVVPYELLFEAYRFKTNPDLEDNHNLPHNRSMARNSVFCSFAGCRRKAIYACCNKKKDGYYETGCEYFSCELHTFHCSANCRKVGRPCEGILHHCDRNKGYCGLITEFGRDRKNSL